MLGKPPERGLPVANEPIEGGSAAPEPGRDENEFAGPGVSSHGGACRANEPFWRHRWSSPGRMKGRWRRSNARPTMLLPAVRVRRLSTRPNLSKSVPCNIFAFGHRLVPVADYLKPKVFSAGPSTRVMAPSEKNVVAYNSVSLAHFDSFVDPRNLFTIVWLRSFIDRCHAYLTRQLVYG
jgi:hypothetical protein